LTVVEYIREDESNPYREWFDGLDAQAAAKVATAALRLEMGNTSRVKWIGANRRVPHRLGTRLSDLYGEGRQRLDYPLRWRHEEKSASRYTASGGAIRGIQGTQSRDKI
jgi:hypothetical protein